MSEGMSERERLVGVLDAHGRDGRKSYVTVACVCGWRGASLEHHSHIADELLTAGFRYVPPENYHSCNPFCEQH